MANSIEELAQRHGLAVGEVESIRGGIVAMISKVKPSLAQTDFTMETTFAEVGLDSLKVISVVFEIEEFFNVDIVGRSLEAVSTLGETVAVVAGLVAERHKQAARAEPQVSA